MASYVAVAALLAALDLLVVVRCFDVSPRGRLFAYLRSGGASFALLVAGRHLAGPLLVPCYLAVSVAYLSTQYYYCGWFGSLFSLRVVTALRREISEMVVHSSPRISVDPAPAALSVAIVAAGAVTQRSGTVPTLPPTLEACAALALAALFVIPLFVRRMWNPAQSSVEAVIGKYYGFAALELFRLIRPKGLRPPAESSDSLPFVVVPEGPHRSVVAIQVESLDSSLIGLSVEGEVVMPFLTAHSRGASLYRPYCLSYHGFGGTSDADFTALNGDTPPQDAHSMHLADYPNSVARRLRGGWLNLAFHGNHGDYFNRRSCFLKMGFDRFYDRRDMDLGQSGWGASDGDVFGFTLKTLERLNGRPFFAYCITMTSHMPFRSYLRCAYRPRRFSEQRIMNDFYNSFRYVDDCLSTFVRAVTQRIPECSILIFGDHSSKVQQDGYASVSLRVGDERLEFTPLFLVGAGESTAGAPPGLVSLLDVGPTILHLAGRGGMLPSRGRDLLGGQGAGAIVTLKGRAIDRPALERQLEELRAVRPTA